MSSKITEQKADPEKVGEVIKKASAEKNTGVFIYVGPQVKGLQRFASFVNGYPEHLKEHLEKCPAFKNLFVQPEHFNAVQIQLADETSVEFMFYKKTEEYFSEVK